jgi:hypothetical protein
MDPLDPEPPGGDAHRHDRLLVWAATAGALSCAVLIFLATNSFFADGPEPVAEPAPTTAFPLAASSTITNTTTTTTVAPTTTTTTPPPSTTTTTTTTRRTTTTRTATPTTTHATTTTTPKPTATRRCGTAQWQWDRAYNGGSVVAWDGALWVAKWWNYNAVPGDNDEGVWEFARDC